MGLGAGHREQVVREGHDRRRGVEDDRQ
jgi:hypothetical protein